ncbi:hypothetical protein EDC03_2074 [Pseudokineococcus lusitanus]|uniref:Uncharacterized protein n=1 Tax=Pseudokineococcus lusitanus TaxID=763993 RepID=A0A3N1HJW0_9ACTN|nr:hypothetical protein EDC03_2074 [Pseudokineococcus lusitanus]
MVVNELPTVTALPHLAVSQTRDVKRDTLNGTITGSVEVAYTRTAQHVPLTDVALEKALAVNGWRIEVPHGGTDWTGDHHVDRFSVLVVRASEPVPVIDAEVPAWAVEAFSGYLPMRLRDRLTTSYAGSAEVYVKTNSGQHLGTVVGADGIRRVRIGVTAGLGIGTGQWNATQLADEAADVFRQMVGTHADMLGVIASVEMGDHKVWGDVYAHGVGVSATFTLISRTAAE